MAFKGVELREEIKTMVDLSACICFSKEECRVYFGNHNKVGGSLSFGHPEWASSLPRKILQGAWTCGLYRIPLPEHLIGFVITLPLPEVDTSSASFAVVYDLFGGVMVGDPQPIHSDFSKVFPDYRDFVSKHIADWRHREIFDYSVPGIWGVDQEKWVFRRTYPCGFRAVEVPERFTNLKGKVRREYTWKNFLVEQYRPYLI
jgi:hypothetical protein